VRKKPIERTNISMRENERRNLKFSARSLIEDCVEGLPVKEGRETKRCGLI